MIYVLHRIQSHIIKTQYALLKSSKAIKALLSFKQLKIILNRKNRTETGQPCLRLAEEDFSDICWSMHNAHGKKTNENAECGEIGAVKYGILFLCPALKSPIEK